MSRKIIYSPKAPEPIGPYSQAVFIKDTLYVSGQIAIDAGTKEMISDDIKKEARQVMKNIKAILKEAGLSIQDVVKSSIFVKDLNNFEAINEIYEEEMEGNRPARETVEVARLPKDANVEISVIAVKL